MVGPTHHCYYGSSSDYDHYHYYPAAPAALPHTCLGPHRLGAHGLRPVHQSLARGSRPPTHGPGQPLRPLPLPARGLAPADPLLKCLGPYRLGAHGGIHFRRSRFCWDPATTSSLPLLYLYPDACRPAVSAAQVPGPVKTRSPRGASIFAEAESAVGTQRRPRRYRSFTTIPTPAAPLWTRRGPRRPQFRPATLALAAPAPGPA